MKCAYESLSSRDYSPSWISGATFIRCIREGVVYAGVIRHFFGEPIQFFPFRARTR